MKDIPLARQAPPRRTGTSDDDAELARTRVRFLTSEHVEPDEVRRPILASWWRSREFRVPADRVDPRYVGEQDHETPLLHGSQPVLRRLGEQIDGQPISLILTDMSGVVLAQHTGDSDLHRHLESVELVPGFSYGERFVGTNGIGTALEDDQPTYVFGHEHYAEHLENLACAGVPIHHPISGKMVGALDLTCWHKDAGGLLVALAKTTAEQIRQALLTQTSPREMTLFRSYLQTCRRSTGVVLAFNENTVMMNDHARRLLDPADQSVLLAHAVEALSERRRGTVVVALSSGSKVRMHCRVVAGAGGGDTAGSVLTVKLIETDQESSTASPPMLPMYLPGVVGSAPLWLRCGHTVDAGFARGDWLVLLGEPGTGKHSLIKGVHLRRNPAGRLHTLDAADATDTGWQGDLRRELIDDPVDTLVIRHVDQLDTCGVRTLVEVLREAGSGGEQAAGPRVAVTAHPDAESNEDLAELLALFGLTVTVPPLRRHVEDLSELVPLFLGKLSHGRQLTCSPAALHLLMRASWPGNIAQLYDVLRHIAQHCRTASIRPPDLPAEYQSITRRPLKRFEVVERDAIVRTLEEAGGNKVKAAQLLGISRATIYRKIHEYGIVTRDH